MEARSPEFVLDEPAQLMLPAVRAELMTAFTVAEDRRARRERRTWLDTFDWRLYRAGITLQHVSDRGTSELVLTTRDGQRVTSPASTVSPASTASQASRQISQASPARWPAMAAALPPGPVRDRVADVAGIRALLPAVTVVSQIRELRLLNADEKTVARVVVEDMSVAVPGGAPVPGRVWVTEVRGYQAAAHRARNLLAGTAGVTASRRTALDAALEAAGRHALDYTGKVDVKLRPAMRGAEAVSAILLQQLDTLEANVDGLLHDTDTEFLHDLRIAVRRTRSALKLLGDVLSGELTLRFASEFRWLGDITTPVRDLDVQLLEFPAMAAQLVAATPADLEPFHGYLARRRTAERRKLSRSLRSARFASVVGDWRKALLVPRATRRTVTGPSAADLSADRTKHAYARVIRLGATITDSSPAENLHTLRKRSKELRYVLEFFASLYDPQLYRSMVGELKRLQDCLGEFQDSEVQREAIQSLAAAMLAQRAAPAATLLGMGEMAAQLGVRQHRARAEFAARFAGFAGNAGQRRITALTSGVPS